MKNDILERYWKMKREAPLRGIAVSDYNICTLVLADVIDRRGAALTEQLKEIDKTLIEIGENVS